jgi:aminoglycoside phosphotransferase (APT) family kinase protein
MNERSLVDAAAGSRDVTVRDALRAMMLVSAHSEPRLTPLSGGVSSAIYRADLPTGVVCVKRALSQLRVAATWHAPIERNQHEAAWLRIAHAIVPDAVPAVLGEDVERHVFAMTWLPPERYPVWKSLLRDGIVGAITARAVGEALGRIHAATADRPDVAARFGTDDVFEAIRIEPYLLATARAHPDLAQPLTRLAATTRMTRRALVHGDYSPKNLLVGPAGPVIVDAECAWFGDPAFDLAFVLNHLMLKALWRPASRGPLAQAFDALRDAYVGQVRWEAPHEVDARAAALLPGLMLARVDGKSPVEYLTDPRDRDAVRRFARAHLQAPASSTSMLAERWFAERTP